MAKGIQNLTQPEINTIIRALEVAGATENERQIFFNPVLCERRITSWITAIRNGSIGIPDHDGESHAITSQLFPCTD